MLIKNQNISKNFKIHPTAIVEDNVLLGENIAIWDNVHIRKDTQLVITVSLVKKPILLMVFKSEMA